ncbi:MAG: hypothetical protein WCP91_02975 [Candidatus Berkelbacteria bacterium]
MAGISLKFRLLMALSGATGLTMFILANFYLNAHAEWKLATALLQITANAFVFASWLGGFRQATPRTPTKLLSLIGFVVPCCMASVTFFRVVLPCVIDSISKT